jgi:hypothetical protein
MCKISFILTLLGPSQGHKKLKICHIFYLTGDQSVKTTPPIVKYHVVGAKQWHVHCRCETYIPVMCTFRFDLVLFLISDDLQIILWSNRGNVASLVKYMLCLTPKLWSHKLLILAHCQFALLMTNKRTIALNHI